MQKKYIVYIKIDINDKMTVGVASNMISEIARHEYHSGKKNRVSAAKVVYYEEIEGIRAASAREKELKLLGKAELTAIVKSANPEMLDLGNIWKEKDNGTTTDIRYII